MPIPALLVVDVQNDFCPGGALPVPRGDEIVPVLNRAVELFVQAHLPVYASRDWHPRRTTHFQEHGGTWPAHCVQGSPGAEFHPDLRLPAQVVIISKGMERSGESYSCFQGGSPEGVPFAEVVQGDGIQQLVVGGLATDYCVKATVLDARARGLGVTVLSDGIRGVELKPGDVDLAIKAMEQAGARFATLDSVRVHLTTAAR